MASPSYESYVSEADCSYRSQCTLPKLTVSDVYRTHAVLNGTYASPHKAHKRFTSRAIATMLIVSLAGLSVLSIFAGMNAEPAGAVQYTSHRNSLHHGEAYRHSTIARKLIGTDKKDMLRALSLARQAAAINDAQAELLREQMRAEIAGANQNDIGAIGKKSPALEGSTEHNDAQQDQIKPQEPSENEAEAAAGEPSEIEAEAAAGEQSESDAAEAEEGHAEGESPEGIKMEADMTLEEEIEEAEKERTKHFTATDFAMAIMLIGGVSFVMILQTLVNYEDDDIRRYAWALISTVTSIFVAVMIFSSINEWVLCYTFMYSKEAKCAVQYVHCFVWCCCLQLTLAIASGSVGEGKDHGLDLEQWVFADAMRADYGKHVYNEKGDYDETVVRNRSGTKSVTVLDGIEVPVEKKRSNLEQRHRRMKCWGTLLAHMSGFAAINAGGTMQHLEVFASSPYHSLLPVLINQLFINFLFCVFKGLRDSVKRHAQAAGQKGVRAAMFDEFSTDSENDISCLAGSFLLVQSLRYFLVGELPNMLGEIEHTPWQCVYSLYGIGVALVMLSVVVIVVKARLALEETSCALRFFNILAGLLGMSFAWCFLFSSRTVFMKSPVLVNHGLSMETVAGRILLALSLSLVSAGFIFLFDCIDDLSKAGVTAGKSPGGEIISQLVFAKSILVGFSWEHSFDGGVEAIAGRTDAPLVCESALAVFMWVAVVPAWRKHILRKALMLQDYYAKQARASQNKAGGYHLYAQVPEGEHDDPSILQPPTPYAKDGDPVDAEARAMFRSEPESNGL